MAERASLHPAWTKIGRSSNTAYYQAGDDVLIVLPDAGLKDDETSARENVAFQVQFAEGLGRRVGLVVNLSSLLSQDSAARRVYSSLDPRLFRGSALVVRNPLARAIGSFFMGLSRPKFPAKLVESIDDGIAWFGLAAEHGGPDSRASSA
jgi:hypothetical protein